MGEKTYYKLCTIKRSYGIPIGGHSILIYKNNDNSFQFFDPNSKIYTNLDKEKIVGKIMKRTQYGEVAIMNNEEFLKAHNIDAILARANSQDTTLLQRQ